MSSDIFNKFNLDNDDINSNIYLYLDRKINNAILKIKALYPYYFFTNTNNEIDYFKIDPKETGYFNVLGDSLSNSSVNSWPYMLKTLLNKDTTNFSISASVSNDCVYSSTVMNSVLLDTSYKNKSSIIFYFNDYRSVSTRTLYQSIGMWEYQNLLQDIYASLSVPQHLIVPARNMTVVSGSWTTGGASNNLAISTNGLNNLLRYNFTNKRYVYVSFQQFVGKVSSKWDILINSILVACHYNTTVLTVNTALGANFYTSGVFIDLGSNQDIELDIKYMGSTLEYNWVNWCCAYNSDDIKDFGRNCLALSINQMDYLSSSSGGFNQATQVKRYLNKEAVQDAVYTCQAHGLKVYMCEIPELGPMSSAGSGFLTVYASLIANTIYRYINMGNLLT